MEKFQFNAFSSDNISLAGQVILITGASQGIGRTLALHAAKAGATVIIMSKSVKKLEALYDEIVENGWPEPAIHPINLLKLDPAGAQVIAQHIYQIFGRLDAIVHNASTTGQITPLEHLPPEKWIDAIQLNLNVPYLLTHTLLPLLKKSENPSIIFTGANEALNAKAYWSAYSASKYGILGLAKALHEELESNSQIRVNCINPGKVRTAMRVNAYPGIDPMTFTDPVDLMPTYLHLLSDMSKEIRGKWVEA